MSDDALIVPKESYADMAHALGDATLNSIPIIGPAGAFLYNELVKPAYSRRQAEFWEEVARRIQALEKDGRVTFDQLKSDPAFTDALMQASLIVTRTSSEEKREALRNAVLNSALPYAPEESKQMMFLNWIDTYTPWHLRILSLFADPQGWADRNHQKLGPDYNSWGLDGLLKIAYPSIRSEVELIKQISHDLIADRHIKSEAELEHGRGGYPRVARLTSEFLKFISEPPPE